MNTLRFKFAVVGGAVVLGALTLAGCPVSTERNSFTVEKTLPFAADDLLSVNAKNGKISVHATKNISEVRVTASVKVEMRQYGSPTAVQHALQDLLDEIEIKVVPVSVGVSIETISPEVSFPPDAIVTVDYDIEVPEQAGLRVDSGNGDVSIDGTIGSVDTDLGNGDISLTGIQGNLDVRLGNGSLQCLEIAGVIDAEVGNGRVTVSHKLPLLAEERWSVEVGNGSVTARLTEGSAFKVSASASVGDIQKGCFGFDVDRQWPGIGEQANAQEGEGGGTIDISMGSGDIEFECL